MKLTPKKLFKAIVNRVEEKIGGQVKKLTWPPWILIKNG